MKKVEAQYQVEQLKKETAAKLSGYKKKVLAGKLPTPGQQAAFNTLDEEAKEKFLAKLDEAKAKQPTPTAATTPAKAAELYLDKLTYIHKQNEAITNTTRTINDQQERIDKKIQLLSKKLKTDLTSLPQYNPRGDYQAFSQGRRIFYRPEMLIDPEFNTFQKTHRLHHRNTSKKTLPEVVAAVLSSGGQMASTTDKIRRGLPPGGMSPKSDLSSGGANYFFTRIKTKGGAYRQPGFVWKASAAARMDAISYNSDYFGRTTDNHVQQHRKMALLKNKWEIVYICPPYSSLLNSPENIHGRPFSDSSRHHLSLVY